MEGLRTGLIVVTPEAESAVRQLRLELDPVAALGAPAHVTVLFPFMPATQIDEDVLARLARGFSESTSFDYGLVSTGWFGEDVLWLASDADDEFRSLTNRVWDEFPDYPPYEGAFEAVVPHLTVAATAPIDAMRLAEAQVRRDLPIRASARVVTLMVEQFSGRWKPTASFSLKC